MTEFVLESFDKFKNIRRRTTARKMTHREGDLQVQIGLLYIETEHLRRLYFDFEYENTSWAALQHGKLILHVDGQNHSFSPSEHSSEVDSELRSQFGTVYEVEIARESCVYEISPEDLEGLLLTSHWEVQISGRLLHHEFVVPESAILLFRQFYNQVFDNSAFVEAMSYRPPHTSSCFPLDSLVRTPSGLQEIGTLSVGDPVISWACDGLRTCQVTKTRLHAPTNIMSIRLATARASVRLTGSHTVLSERGWVRASTLSAGDLLVRVDTHGLAVLDLVESIGIETTTHPVISIYTASEHNFIVNGLVAHNFSTLRRFRTFLHQVFVDPITARSTPGAARAGWPEKHARHDNSTLATRTVRDFA